MPVGRAARVAEVEVATARVTVTVTAATKLTTILVNSYFS